MTLQKILTLLKRATRTTKLPSFALEYDPNEQRLAAYVFSTSMRVRYTTELSDKDAIVALDVHQEVNQRRIGLAEYEYVKKVKGVPEKAKYQAGDMRAVMHLVKQHKIKTMLELYEHIVSEDLALAAELTNFEEPVIVEYSGMLLQEDMDILDVFAMYRDPERFSLDALIVAEGWTTATNGHFMKQKVTGLSEDLGAFPAIFGHALLDAGSDMVAFSDAKCASYDCTYAYARLGEDSCEQLALYDNTHRAKVYTLHDIFTNEEDVTTLYHEELFDFLCDIEDGDYDEKLYVDLTPVHIKIPHHKKIDFEFDPESETWSMSLGMRIKDGVKASKNTPYTSEMLGEFEELSDTLSLPILRDLNYQRSTQYHKQRPVRFSIRLDYLKLVVSDETVQSIKLQHEGAGPVKNLCAWSTRKHRGIAMGYSQ